ncbi:AAA family ATPase [Persephonella sp.]
MVKTEIAQIEQALLGGLIRSGVVISKDSLSVYDFSVQIHGELYDHIFNFYQEERELLENDDEDRFILFAGYLMSKGVFDKYKNLIPYLNMNAAPDNILPFLVQQIKKVSASNKLKRLAKQIVKSEIDIETAIKDIRLTIDEVEEAGKKEGLKRLHIGKFIQTKPPEIDRVFNGFPAGTVGVLASQAGLGKSMFILEVLTAVATGVDVSNGAINVGKVDKCSYISLEDAEPVLHYRIYNLMSFLHPNIRQRLEENLSIYSNTEIFELVDVNGVVNQNNVDELKRIAEGQRLVVVDTLRRVHSADENKAGHMSTLLQVFEVIAKETGCAFILVHHVGKTEGNKSRGSSVLYDNIRYQINLEPVNKKDAKNIGISDHTRVVRLLNTKSNYAPLERERLLIRVDHGVLRLFDDSYVEF